MSSKNQELLKQAYRETYEEPSADQHKAVQDKIKSLSSLSNLLKSEKGLWVCPGTVAIDHEGGSNISTNGRLLYPPETHWGHVEFKGTASGLVFMPNSFYSIGTAYFYVSADELSKSQLDISINAGGVGPGGINLGFTRNGQDIGFFVGGALADGLIIATGTVNFKRVD